MKTKAKRMERDYQDVKQYVGQLLYSYKKWEQVKMAWEDCLLIFQKESKMYQAIQKALHMLDGAETEKQENSLEKAFDEITGVYNSKGIKVLHMLLGQMIRMRRINTPVVDWFLAEVNSDEKNSFWLDRRKCLDFDFEEEFLYWILDTSLYLKYENSVYHALQNSSTMLSEEFEKEVEHLVQNLYEKPASLEPYMKFFREKENGYVRQMLQLLYSVNYDNVEQVINQICDSCHKLLQCKAENTKKKGKHRRTVVSAFGKFFVGIVGIAFLYYGATMADANIYYSEAKSYYERTRCQLENLQFSEEAVQSSRKNAMEHNYRLEIQCFGNESRDARLTLYGTYVFPVIGMKKEFVIDGYAR